LEQFSLRGAALIVLANGAEELDRPAFVEGLDSSQLEVLAACFSALEQLPPAADPRELAALVKVLRRLGSDPAEYPLRERAVRLLERATRQKIRYLHGPAGYKPQPEAVEAWTNWLQMTHPEAAAELFGGGDDLAQWKERLQAVDWNAGNAERGLKLFQARGCAQCHGGSRALGPDLKGVTGRFSREDLFTAIVAPDRDVSPRYQTTLVETVQGKTFTGLIIYEAKDGLILRNGANQTFRFEAREIAAQRRISTSLMPSGLLKDLENADLADLAAYLQSLGP